MAQTVPEELLAEISAAFERDPNINLHQWPFKVWTAEGQIVLDGTVENIAAKRVAVNTAQKLTEGRWPLMDLLRVTRPGACPDLELGDEVGRNLTREPVFARYDLETSVGSQVKNLQDVDAEDGAIRANIHEHGFSLR